MKQSEAMPVGEILKAMMECDGNADEMNRQKIIYFWPEIVGAYINKHTTRRYIDADTLHAFIDSASLKSELAFMLPQLVEQLNNTVGKKIIKKIVLH